MKLLSLTEIGRTRKDNQDNFWSARLDVSGVEHGVLCLCDGMGGLHNGGLASKCVVEAVKKACLSGINRDEIITEIELANLEIYKRGKQEGSMLGTTCTVVVSNGTEYFILQVGDSRCYLCSKGKTSVLTTDHSALQKYGDVMKKDPALYKKYKNTLTRCIGVKPTVNVDVYNGTCSKGDKFLVCSDGFWHFFNPEDLNNVDSEADLRVLIDRCMSKGEADNISASILMI